MSVFSKDLGSIAAVGRSGCCHLGKIRFKGCPAWMMWLLVHLRPILGARNKLFVLLNWLWNYITYDYSLRLIIYARKAKEIRDREKREETTHWGEDLFK